MHTSCPRGRAGSPSAVSPSWSRGLVPRFHDGCAERRIVQPASRDGYELRVEIDGDLMDALDLGHLLAYRHRAVVAMNRRNAVGDRLAHRFSRSVRRSIPPV